MVERRSKLIEPGDVPAFFTEALPDGGTVSLGGSAYSNRPNALVRQLIKAGVRNLKVFAGPINTYDIDLLVGAAVIKETFCPMVTALQFGMAPNWRKWAESGAITAHGIDEPTMLGGFMAAGMGIPYMPLACLRGSDLPKVNTLLKRYTPPFGDEDLYAVQAISPDLAIIHAQEADTYGNIRDGTRGAAHMEAKAAKKVLVSVDRLLPYEETLKEPWKTTVPCIYVDAVVEIPYGAHPAGSTGLYGLDQDHISSYWDAAGANAQGSTELFQGYLKKYIFEPTSVYDYLERIGGLEKLRELDKRAQVDP